MMMLRWICVFWLGVLICFAAIGFIENPANNVFVGITVLYCGVFIFAVAGIKILQRSDW